ncbi:MAG: hypothetical protein ACI39W_08875 [Brotaphodocola sp.]
MDTLKKRLNFDLNPTNQRILSFLHLEIGSYIRNNNGPCEVIPAPFAVFLHNEDESDPLKKTIVIYDMEHDDGPVLHSLSDTIKVNIYDDLEIDFSKLHI